MYIFVDYTDLNGSTCTARVKFNDKEGISLLIEAAWITGTGLRVVPSAAPIIEELDKLRADLGGKFELLFCFSSKSADRHLGWVEQV